jgi:hypothetical protein
LWVRDPGPVPELGVSDRQELESYSSVLLERR